MRDPYSQEAERGVLGAMLIKPELIDLLASDLLEADFFFPDNRVVFRAILAMHARQQRIDALTVGDHIGRMPDDSFALAFTGELHRTTPSAANALEYARIVKERSIDRALMQAAEQVHEIASSDAPAQDKLAQAQALVLGVDAKAATAEVVSAADVMRTLVDEWERRADLGGELDGLSTGLKDLDDKLQGLRPEQLIVVAGRAKMGKTTFAMGIARHSAIRAKKSVLVVSLEMANHQLLDRVAAAEGSVPLTLIRQGKAFDRYALEMSAAASKIIDSSLHLADIPGITMSRIRSLARRHKRVHGLDLLVIDHLSLVDHEDRKMSAIQRTTENTRLAKLIAKELKIPVILLSQLNRALEQRPNKRPIPSDLRDSGSIEQDADVVLFVYRDEVYHPDTQFKGVAEVIIGLGRDVESGTVFAGYQGEFNRFVNLDSSWRQPEPQPPHKPYAQKARGLEV